MIVQYAEALACYRKLPDQLQFPSYHPDYVIQDAKRDAQLLPRFFIYEEDQKLYYHAFHLANIPEAGMKDIQSPYGYGGPISNSMDSGFLHRARNAYVEWCKGEKILAEFIRFHPLLNNQAYYHGEAIKDRETVWIDLSLQDLFESYQTRVRRKIRKARKNGVRIEQWNSERFKKPFMALYGELMVDLQSSDFYKFPEIYFDIVHHDYVYCLACLVGDELIGGGVYLAGPTMMEYHLSASSAVGKSYDVTNLMMHEAAILGQRLGCEVMHLGGGTDSSVNNSLLFFKSGFSNNRSQFYIGKTIFFPSEYEHMKQRWQERSGETANRVLFYRK